MNKTINAYQMPLLVFLGLCALETLAILYANSGHFLYTLDDPYIHLSLAENIAKGHYGINLSEFSAPSSSILWPFLLAPFMTFEFAPYMPLILNILASLGTIMVLAFLSTQIIKSRFGARVIVMVLMLATNLIALTFTGMEHCLQVFVTLIIAVGLIVDTKEGSPPWWLLLATVIEPLIRYEGVLVTAVTILYFVCRRYYKVAFWCSVTALSLLGGFSWFLLSLGLESLPNSVIVKMFTHTNGGNWAIGIFRAELNLQSRAGAILVCGLLFLTGVLLDLKRPLPEKFLTGWAAIITIGHLVTAPLRDTSIFIQVARYDAYVMAILFVILLYAYRDFFSNILQGENPLWVVGQAAVLLVFIAHPYLMANLLTPIASNNIYEQQYQMHRFLKDHHRQPIAVNDLGLTSYGNPNYVLDLWGLGKLDAFYARVNRESKDWMDHIAKSHHVPAAIIYDTWFPTIPQHWIRVATLHLSKLRLTPAEPQVSFYVLDKSTLPQTYAALKAFEKGLPTRVRLKFETSAYKALENAPIEQPFAQIPRRSSIAEIPKTITAQSIKQTLFIQTNSLTNKTMN